MLAAQVDALGRQLARGAADGQEVAAARENLLGELTSAQQVRLLLERNREDLQRQLAVSEGKLGLLQEHLAEAQQEVDGLRQRISLEQGRTAGVFIWQFCSLREQAAASSCKVLLEACKWLCCAGPCMYELLQALGCSDVPKILDCIDVQSTSCA
jgi:hypothetical protein